MTPHELLANIPLFESLTDDDVDALATRLETVEYGEGETIFCQGDEGSAQGHPGFGSRTAATRSALPGRGRRGDTAGGRRLRCLPGGPVPSPRRGCR